MAVESQTQSAEIHELSRDDIPRLDAIAARMRTPKDAEYFPRNFDFVEAGERLALVISHEDQDAGYCVLNWSPKYALFKKLDIPEIQDLSIIPAMRRKGIATALITYCENLAREKGCAHMGIGVAVNASSGPAQILYAQHGYIPDGNGVSYDRKLVAAGEFKPLDDQLCMMMVKALKF